LLIQENRDKKSVIIWLSNEDQADETFMASLDQIIKDWTDQKYFPVIFRSGKNDLYENTYAMLKHNRELSAQYEVKREKARKTL